MCIDKINTWEDNFEIVASHLITSVVRWWSYLINGTCFCKTYFRKMFRRDGKHRNRINRVRGRIRNLVYVTAVETFAKLESKYKQQRCADSIADWIHERSCVKAANKCPAPPLVSIETRAEIFRLRRISVSRMN